ncbi:MAG: hypothetical protein Q8R25_01995 [bacterium]|nr:hypothetical protein [bacterium]
MDLLKRGSFISHSGKVLMFKIECDALSDESIETAALRIAASHTFSRVVPIPRGGLRLAAALEKYCTSHGGTIIADDVFTTGGSMEEIRSQIGGDKNIPAFAIFARGLYQPPPLVKVIFQTSKWAEGLKE